jgi:hypothetical protein
VIGPEYTHEQYPVAPRHHISEEERKKVNVENGEKRKEALLFYSLFDTLRDKLEMTPNHIFFSRKAGRKKGWKRIRKKENMKGRKDDKNVRRKEEKKN